MAPEKKNIKSKKLMDKNKIMATEGDEFSHLEKCSYRQGFHGVLKGFLKNKRTQKKGVSLRKQIENFALKSFSTGMKLLF